jgi:hypothetical integral membrane protein (TIGR02206 family)
VDDSFQRFGLVHLAVLSAVPLSAAVLAWISRGKPRTAAAVRVILGLLLLAIEVGWLFYLVGQYSWDLSYGLPLQLTDAIILLAGYVALTRNQTVFDVIYYWSLTAMPLAMITPDLDEAFHDIFTIVFFAGHGLAVVITLVLLWSRSLRPRPGSLALSLLMLNAFALFVFIFNRIFDTNYMYLIKKPEQPSLLDFMGPWPLYILACEAVALVLFWLLWLPYRTRARS